MSYNLPILLYLRVVLDEHTIPLADPGTGFIESVWLIAMIHKVEAAYREYGTI
jgi:hypothetical protein